jgi:hypothetical protein
MPAMPMTSATFPPHAPASGDIQTGGRYEPQRPSAHCRKLRCQRGDA